MSDISSLHEALVARVLDGDGRAPASMRRSAFNNHGLDGPLRELVGKVAHQAHTVTDQTSSLRFIEVNWDLGFIDGTTLPPGQPLGSFSFDQLAEAGFYCLGDPDTVARQLREFYEAAGGFGCIAVRPAALDSSPRPSGGWLDAAANSLSPTLPTNYPW